MFFHPTKIMEMLISYIQRKRKMCIDIAESYREKSRAYQQLGDKIRTNRIASPYFPRYVVKPFQNFIGNYYLDRGEEFDKKSIEYEKLARSGKVRFIPSVALFLILKELEHDLKPSSKFRV